MALFTQGKYVYFLNCLLFYLITDLKKRKSIASSWRIIVQCISMARNQIAIFKVFIKWKTVKLLYFRMGKVFLPVLG